MRERNKSEEKREEEEVSTLPTCLLLPQKWGPVQVSIWANWPQTRFSLFSFSFSQQSRQEQQSRVRDHSRLPQTLQMQLLQTANCQLQTEPLGDCLWLLVASHNQRQSPKSRPKQSRQLASLGPLKLAGSRLDGRLLQVCGPIGPRDWLWLFLLCPFSSRLHVQPATVCSALCKALCLGSVCLAGAALCLGINCARYSPRSQLFPHIWSLESAHFLQSSSSCKFHQIRPPKLQLASSISKPLPHTVARSLAHFRALVS